MTAVGAEPWYGWTLEIRSTLGGTEHWAPISKGLQPCDVTQVRLRYAVYGFEENVNYRFVPTKEDPA